MRNCIEVLLIYYILRHELFILCSVFFFFVKLLSMKNLLQLLGDVT